jgi:hypothetical protein
LPPKAPAKSAASKKSSDIKILDKETTYWLQLQQVPTSAERRAPSVVKHWARIAVPEWIAEDAAGTVRQRNSF